ncbi:hypothetical protein MRX96_002024 [Rhipicephalus microplus]
MWGDKLAGPSASTFLPYQPGTSTGKIKGRGPLVGLLACGTLVSCQQNFLKGRWAQAGTRRSMHHNASNCLLKNKKKVTKNGRPPFASSSPFWNGSQLLLWRVLLQKN